MLEHEMVSETFITLASDTSTSIAEVKIKFGLVCKQHVTEMLSLPVDVVKGKHLTLAVVFLASKAVIPRDGEHVTW